MYFLQNSIFTWSTNLYSVLALIFCFHVAYLCLAYMCNLGSISKHRVNASALLNQAIRVARDGIRFP